MLLQQASMAVRHALGRAVVSGLRRRIGLLSRRSMSADEGTDAKALWEAQVGFGKRVSTKLQESKQLIQVSQSHAHSRHWKQCMKSGFVWTSDGRSK